MVIRAPVLCCLLSITATLLALAEYVRHILPPIVWYSAPSYAVTNLTECVTLKVYPVTFTCQTTAAVTDSAGCHQDVIDCVDFCVRLHSITVF